MGIPLVETLESRVFLSASAAAPLADMTAASATYQPAAWSSDAVAQRKALLAHLPGPIHASLSKALRNSGPDAFDASLLKYMRRRQAPYFFFNPGKLGDYVDTIRTKRLYRIDTFIDQADKILKHLFPEQSNSETYTVQLGTNIDWDAQPKSTSNANFVHTLNTHVFWQDLAVAYRFTNDGKYVREIISQLQSWSAQNPKLKDPNAWSTSGPGWWLLNTADRVNNWTYAYFMVYGSSDWTPAANTLFLSKLYEHADFLDRVTLSGYNKNRTVRHAEALQRLGILFPEFDNAAVWEYEGTDMTFRCLERQFYPDGGHVEQTPVYAGSVISSMVHNYRLSELNGRTYWTKNRRRWLRNAVEAQYQLLGIGGAYMGLSDTYRASNPKRYLTEAAFALDDARYDLDSVDVPDLFLLARNQVSATLNRPITKMPKREPAYALPDAGYYVLRSHADKFQNFQLVFDAGPKGGSHGHYDLFSFEVSGGAMGFPVADPGPYQYDDSADRQWVISTPAHNTVSIDGLNHDVIEEAHSDKIVVDAMEVNNDYAMIAAHHHAYASLPGSPVVGRTIWIETSRESNYGRQVLLMLVIDWVRSASGVTHTFTTSLNFPGTRSTQTANGLVDVYQNSRYGMKVQTLSPAPLTSTLVDSFISNSPPPDAKSDAQHYAASQTGTSALFVTMISQYIPVDPSKEIHWSPAVMEFEETPQDGQPVKLKLTLSDGTIRHLSFTAPDLTPLQ